MAHFALIGAAAFVAPRHLTAIRDTGQRLVAAVDPHDAVGPLDRFFPQARFFREIERFDRYLEHLRRTSSEERVQYLSICSPNYLHDAHVHLTLRQGAHAICEKPLVLDPGELDAIAELEQESGCRAWTVLQLRLHPTVVAFKRGLVARPPTHRSEVVLTYVTPRGPWYLTSWKGAPEKSGGLAMNIGVHLFDLLLWLFGPLERSVLHRSDPLHMAGILELLRARVRWFLSIDEADLAPLAGRQPHRSMTVDGESFDFSSGFEDLHTRVYAETLAGRGFGIEDARPSLELVKLLRQSEIVPAGPDRHPLLFRAGAGS